MDRLYFETRSQIDGNTLIGHASVFGVMAKMPTYFERMAPSAFDEVLEDKNTDVRALINHDPQLIIGRQSSGTLRLHTDSDGLAFEVDLPDTSYAHDLRSLVARGDITGASFGFLPGKDTWTTEGGQQIRTHISIRDLRDISPVTFPAYEGADVALRHQSFIRLSNRTRLIRARAATL